MLTQFKTNLEVNLTVIKRAIAITSVIVVYNIPENKRRKKRSYFLEGYGRIQDSVFECFISLDKMQQLYRGIGRKVNMQGIGRLW